VKRKDYIYVLEIPVEGVHVGSPRLHIVPTQKEKKRTIDKGRKLGKSIKYFSDPGDGQQKEGTDTSC